MLRAVTLRRIGGGRRQTARWKLRGDRRGSLLRERPLAILPGQYFDAETGLHQNWHRDYDPSIGRYLQSDPIGLDGGLSTYGYALQNPLRYDDPSGLVTWTGSYSQFATAPGIGAVEATFDLTSECDLNKKRGKVKVLARGVAAGLAIADVSQGEARFVDSNVYVDTKVFEGDATFRALRIPFLSAHSWRLGGAVGRATNSSTGGMGPKGARGVYGYLDIDGSSIVIQQSTEDCECETE